MKIINRYILKEHVGPFVFALSALTSLLLLQYIARKFGDLVGRGLSWQVITEFLLLSIPLTVELTVPMAVLVSVLYAFSRLASENEVTALKAGGVSTRSLMIPSIIWATVLACIMLWFNDQIESRANHELATLQMAILRTKPTFALRPQVINNVKEGSLYLRAGRIDEATDHMHEVTIYDMADPQRRRTIYADSGILAFAPNRRDLNMSLFHGVIISTPTDKPEQLTRVYYQRDELKVRDVANIFTEINSDTSMKGDREMSVCEMQKAYEIANARVEFARWDSLTAAWRLSDTPGHHVEAPVHVKPKPAGGIGAVYCTLLTKYFRVQVAHADELPKQQPAQLSQDTSKKAKAPVPSFPPAAAHPIPAQQPGSIFVMLGSQYVKVPRDKIPPDAYLPGGIPIGAEAKRADSLRKLGPKAPGAVATPAPGASVPGAVSVNPGVPALASPVVAPGKFVPPEIRDAAMRLDDARRQRNRYGVEIQKKFSLAAACIVFVLVGAPIALRFPRGGVGLVIGASFFTFAVYYVGLIGGEALSDKNIVSPFLAMWIDNILFFIIGVLLITRMGREGVTNRGGRLGEIVDSLRDRFSKRAKESHR
ncbi:MAG: LptF/LptG family permease [Gemmatimonadaceae bacterium]